MLTALNTFPSIMAKITAGSRLMGNGLFAMRWNYHFQHRVHVPVRSRIGEQVYYNLLLRLRYLTQKTTGKKDFPWNALVATK
jgi:hypothetical protein